MKTRNLIIALLIIAGLTILLINPTPTVMNQRINQATSSSNFTSRLENMTADETLTDKLSELQQVTKFEPLDPESRAVQTGDRISVNYRGWFAKDAKVFDQSFDRGDTFTFIVGQGVIQGWSQGVVGMKVGEVRRLKIPSALAYAEAGQGDIGPNEDLIFDIELVNFN